MRKFIRRVEKGLILLYRLLLRYIFFFKVDKVCTADTARCDENPYSVNFYWERKGKNAPVCCASHLYELLMFLDKVLTESGIRWFAIIGTQLGIVRHKGLIPWETDGDIGVMESDRAKVFDVLKKNLVGKSYALEEKPECLKLKFSKKNTLHVDIIWGHEEGCNVVFVTKGIRRIYPAASIYPLKMGCFYDREIPVPADDNILKTFYGDKALTHGYKQWSRSKKEFLLTDFSPAPVDFKEIR